VNRKDLERGYTDINALSEQECKDIITEIRKIPVLERSFEEKMALNLTEERLESFERVRKDEGKVDLEERVAKLEEKLAAAEEKDTK